MKKYQINDVKVGVSGGGFACGPVPGAVVVEISVNDEHNHTMYYSLSEVDCIPMIFKTETSKYAMMMMEEKADDEAWEELEKQQYGQYEGYYELYSEMEKMPEAERQIKKLLAYLARADWDEVDEMKKRCVGKYLGTFEIPMSDEEEEYMEELEDEEDDE